MNENFLALPQEKQNRIINAALEVFAQNNYKRASTDDIAARAGISKGLLFYYFHNKQSLYLYVFDYTVKAVQQQIEDMHFSAITDFFELMAYSAQKKLELIEQNPYVMDFAVRAFYSDDRAMQKKMTQGVNPAVIMEQYFKHVDFKKFKPDANPTQILQMLTWMTDGYLNEKRRTGSPIDLHEILRQFDAWSAMFRAISYRESYLQPTDNKEEL